MPFCTKCGNEIAENVNFCPKCGGAQQNEQIPNQSGNATQSECVSNQNGNLVASDSQVKKRFGFYVFGFLCYAFATIDFATGNFFGYDITGVFWSPILAGAIGSVLFAIAYYNERKLGFSATLSDGESIIRSGGANWGKISGELYLTTHRLYFKHEEIQFAELEIEIKQIKDVSFYNKLGFIPTGLAITTLDGEKVEFVVSVLDRKLWKEEIERIKSKIHEKNGG